MIAYERVWAEINLDAIASNIKNIKAKLSQNTKVMAVVKADAYGHGAVEVSNVLLFHGADALGVAISDEGVLLRKNNIHVPILILGFTPEQKLYEVVLNDLTQTIFSYDMAKILSMTAQKLNKEVTVHIKVDSGMGRLGFFPTETSVQEIKHICQLPNIKVTGLYTHFAVSDIRDKTYTMMQYERFMAFHRLLKQHGVDIPEIHVSNSGAVLDLRSMDHTYVRPGIILYGLAPSNEVSFEAYDLTPAMSLKTRVSFLKEVEAGTSIGYGRTFITKRKTKIATIPVGYADGYSRRMSNKGRVLICGAYAPVIGRICMDQFMVDVTEIEGVSAHDEVVLFGKQAGKEISIDEIAEIQNTINYEIICDIGKRVPRVYIKNNSVMKVINYF